MTQYHELTEKLWKTFATKGGYDSDDDRLDYNRKILGLEEVVEPENPPPFWECKKHHSSGYAKGGCYLCVLDGTKPTTEEKKWCEHLMWMECPMRGWHFRRDESCTWQWIQQEFAKYPCPICGTPRPKELSLVERVADAIATKTTSILWHHDKEGLDERVDVILKHRIIEAAQAAIKVMRENSSI